MLLVVMSGCSSILEFPQNVPKFNDGFGSPQLDHQERTVDSDVYLAMPGYGQIVVTLPPGMTLGRQPHGRPPVSVSYAKNRAAGLRGTRWRNLGVRGVAPDAHGVLRLPVPHIDGYRPTSLLVWVRTPEAVGARDMRINFDLTETSVIDPTDAERHEAFWMNHDGQCLDRGRIQPIEYADQPDAMIDGQRHPIRFDTALDGLCVFLFPQQQAIVATDTPGRVLRSPVRVRIPKVYQHPHFSSDWQPSASDAPASAD